ncbi:MAG: carboxylating nicotinate-nucleotide diphosphorylase [Planctomycetaceae bacterium]|jgi:nicotinate-nucleotide pyrophosphorylase (carboxylating)
MAVDTKGIESAERLIEMALEEDLQERGDLTSHATIPESAVATVNVVAREVGALSGAVLMEPVYSALKARMPLSDRCNVHLLMEDGDRLSPGVIIGQVTGPVRVLLAGERIALNFLIHLSGIASLTAEFVQRVQGSRAVVLDTRKTLPGYRLLQKYAVRCGGGSNHRMGLYDGVLIKDNHLAARNHCSVADGVTAARDYLSASSLNLPVEVEVDTLDQLRDVLTVKPDIVLLDNMRTTDLQRAVAMRDDVSPVTLLEASGGIDLESIGCIAGTGVDRISIGGLTHSAPALDIGFDWPTLTEKRKLR